MSHVEMTPDVTTVEIKTACGTRDYPGTLKWTLKASPLPQLRPGRAPTRCSPPRCEPGVPVDVQVIPSAGSPVTATNPRFTGDLIPQPFTPLSG
jgi:hypothetical protein